MRLLDAIEATCRYPRPIATVPEVLLLDIAEPHRTGSLPLGRYYPIIIETSQEHREVEAFLSAERSALVPPDILDRRPSSLAASGILFCRYDPPISGWPWLLVCHWPTTYRDAAGPSNRHGFARGAYTIETLASAKARERLERALFASLRASGPVEIVPVPIAETLGRA